MMSDLLSHSIDLLDDDMLNAVTENQSEIVILGTECVRAPESESSVSPHNLQPTTKIGTRFSRETNGILKAWFSRRTDNPYPSRAEKQQLQQQTGLSSLQLTNWLANARRRSTLSSRGPSPGSLAQLSNLNTGESISRPSTPMTPTPHDHCEAIPSSTSPHKTLLPTAQTRQDLAAQQIFCSFCGINDPDEDHVETHNPKSCQERTFSRKDHLRKHLRLVHNATPVEWIISQWRTPQLQERSKCGFCHRAMETWAGRADHLADHFKMGHTMAQWQGDWSFEKAVHDLVESSIPPYLIASESQTPFPFRASVAPADSPRNAYELIHLELTHFIQRQDAIPVFDMLQLEGCRIILAAEGLMRGDAHDEVEAGSWLRDIFFSNNDISQRARFSPLRSKTESCLVVPKLHGQRQLFDGCPLEAQLRNFMLDSAWSGQAMPSDAELRAEACRIVSELGSCFTFLLEDAVATWLTALIESAPGYLSAFRMRVQIEANIRTPSDGQNASFGGLCGAAHSLQDVMQPPTSITAEPIRHFPNGNNLGNGLDFCGRQEGSLTDNMSLARDNILRRQSRTSTTSQSPQDHRPSWIKVNLYFLNDANYHRWLGRELGRWVLSTTSLNNPNSHIPSDEELRHQARCILYDE
ncbi:uncharacterized protein FPRO_11400 [Fusarium proliferatum ET1]|uniref:Homeobox domain-containing protein n=1 Tax=Fusarium proliferatum (strain ET1) TaxID=1227346 RepID=A0A1L7VZW5_FUSPR|nr:uncharacterized protein FPRO_11400 [Fusarium proliferatum ET1]CZR45953.1 uncharacterized protein FPRO_11400 [Fusarium proliferatum ET1]